MQDTHQKFDLVVLADNWPSRLVGRNQEQLDKFANGLLNARSLANADSLGNGPKGRVRIGRKIAYEKYSLVEWMKSRQVAV